MAILIDSVVLVLCCHQLFTMTTFIEHCFNLIHSDTFNVYWLFYLGYIVIASWIGYDHLSAGDKLTSGLLLLGAAGLLAGIFYAPLSVIPFVWLVPLAVVLLFKKKDHQYYNLLYCAIIPALLLVINKTYGII